MDLRIYFQKMRAIENEIAEPFVIVSSLDTPDGGRAGRLTEVARGVAAQLLVDARRVLRPSMKLANIKNAPSAHESRPSKRSPGPECSSLC